MSNLNNDTFNEVKEIGIDELGQPTINGNPILKFRIPKYM